MQSTPNLTDNKACFVILRLSPKITNLITLGQRWPQDLINTLCVALNQRICHINNRRRRAVVLFEFDQRFGAVIRQLITKILLKIEQNSVVSAPKGIDRLIAITHRKHRTILPLPSIAHCIVCHQQSHQIILNRVGILIFVYQHMAKLTVPVIKGCRILLKQQHWNPNQIIKIKGIISS